jgi:hypothetical protein
VPRPDAAGGDLTQPVRYGEWIRTGLGGAFFLVTVFERLRLFDLLESHFMVESELGSWDWLGLVTHALLDRSAAAFRSDPLWAALDLVSGRGRGDPRSAELAMPAQLRLPAEWHPGAAAAPHFRRAIGRGREQFWHGEGFVVEDRPTAGAPATPCWRMPRGLARLARKRARVALPPALESAGLARFLEFFLPYLRWRLGRALSLAAEADLGAELLVRRADLSLTRSHVDVRMSLASVRLSVRLAGLDADPGWAPSFGRVVSFSYT